MPRFSTDCTGDGQSLLRNGADTAMTIEEIVSLLVQLEPEDRDELEEVVSALELQAEERKADGSGPAVPALLKSAATKLRTVLAPDGAAHGPMLISAAARLVRAATESDRAAEESPESTPDSAATSESTPPPAAEAARDSESPDEDGVSDSSDEPADPPDAEASSDEPFIQVEPGDELVEEFVGEVREYCEGAEGALLELEENPEDREAIDTVFRAFHTVKGVAAMVELDAVSKFAHLAEHLLDRMRSGKIRCVGGYADLALQSSDMLKELGEAVSAALRGEKAEAPEGYYQLRSILEDPEAHGVGAHARSGLSDGRSQPARAARPKKATSAEDGQWIRMRSERLDQLIDMVGELVIAHAMVREDAAIAKGGREAQRKVTHVSKIVRELQDLSMGLRMVPFRATFKKLQRVVRDVAQRQGKSVEFVTVGDDTEIDRNMVESLADPLIHMVRNSVDHGVETPERREERGKHPIGRVQIAAYNSGGNVVVELSDDGGGLDRNRLVDKAVKNGVITADRARTITDAEAFQLVFEAGLSTAEKVSDVSGRGVGMDVVRSNVAALGGRIDIASELGEGTTFTINLPLTLAITDGMLVRVGQERYLIPTTDIQSSLRPEPSMLTTVSSRGELLTLRGAPIPLFRLSRLFEVEGAIDDSSQALAVVVGDGEGQCALLVDELLDQQQVVIKSLGDGIGTILGLSGGAILADGRVGLIVDTAGLLTLARQTPAVTA